MLIVADIDIGYTAFVSKLDDHCQCLKPVSLLRRSVQV